MRYQLTIVSFLLLILFCIVARFKAQIVDVQFEKIPIGIAFCFFEDSNGFLWIGSQEGLARYDGYNLKIYSQIPFDTKSLSNNWVTDIEEDIKGNLWVSTRGGGLNYFNQRTEQFSHYLTETDSLGTISGKNIPCITLNEDGSLWVSTREDGILHMSFDSLGNSSCRTFRFGSSNNKNINSLENFVWCMLQDRNKKLWFGTMGNGLIHFDPETENYRQYKYDPGNPNGIRSNLITSICEDDSGNIWFATGHLISDIPGTGLGRFNPETETFSYFNHDPKDPFSISSDTPFHLFIDRSQTLWIGTNENGVCSIRLKELYTDSKHVFTKYRGLGGDLINRIYEDKQGSIWVGLWAVYMAKYERKKNPFIWYRKEYNNLNSLSSPGIECLFVDRLGNIWFGHHFTGLTKYAPETGTYKHYKFDPKNNNGISSNWINAICEDDAGNIWIGTMDNGIDIYDPTDDSFKNIKTASENENGLRSNQIRFMIKSTTGNLWVSNWHEGLQLFDKDTHQFKYYDIDTNTINDEITSCLFEDTRGTLWIGTFHNGFYSLSLDGNNVKKVKHYAHNSSNRNSLSSNNILDIIQSKVLDSNYLWIATNIGLNRFDLNTEKFTHYFKKDGLPHDYILNLLEDKQGNVWAATPYKISVFNINTEKFYNYGEGEGLPFTGFGGARQNSAVTQGGQLIFGAGSGALGFIPEEVLTKSNTSKICFTDFKLFHENTQLDSAINFKRKIELGHDQNILTFEFSDLNFISTNRNQFIYKLEGLFDEWINIGNERKINFTNLEPGKYKLMVKIADVDRFINVPEASIDLIILPPWWATWWFHAIMFFCFTALIYGIYKYRVKRILEIERMRIQIASDLHDDVGASLTKITVHSEIIQSTVDKNKISQSSLKIGNMSREIITSLSDIIWSIDARNDKVGDLIDRMRDYLDTVFPSGTVSVDFQTHGLKFENGIDQTLRQNIYLIFKEAVNNAAKHSGASEMKIYMTNGNGSFRLEIIDNGKGIELNGKSIGYHGIENMKLRAERIGGELKIESENNTKIILIVKEL